MGDLEAKRYEKYQKEAICEVCGLIIDDEEAEAMKTGRGWHTNGKQHIGYTLIRAKLRSLEKEDDSDRKNHVRTKTPSPRRAKEREEKKEEVQKPKEDGNRRRSRS